MVIIMVLNKVDVNQSGFMVIITSDEWWMVMIDKVMNDEWWLIMVMNNAAKPFVDKHVKHLAKQIIKNQGFVY